MDKFREAENWLNYLSSEARFFRDKQIPKLEVVNIFLDELGRPDKFFEYRIVVGGTAGKGTVCRLLEDILINNGKKVTTLISPHIQVVTERIRLNGLLVSTELFGEAVLTLKLLADKLQVFPTYYEAIVLAGILVGKKNNSDILICEVGMGGEFDAVNAVRGKRISVLTFIGEDHLEILGPKLCDIAETKAGIFTEDSVFNITYEQKYYSILQKKSKSKIQLAKGVKTKLNKKVVRKVCEQILSTSEFEIRKINIPARWEQVAVSQIINSVNLIENYQNFTGKIFLDGAHSLPRFEYIFPKLKKITGQKIGIFAMAKNHDAQSFKVIAQEFDEIYWTKLTNEREFWEPSELKNLIQKGDCSFSDPKNALMQILEKYPHANIFIMGSFYLCGEVRELFYSSKDILEQQTEVTAIADS